MPTSPVHSKRPASTSSGRRNSDRGWIHDVYLGELVAGVIRTETRDRLVEILAGLIESDGADSVVLAGTELSLILPEPMLLGVPVLNAAAIHVAAALDWLIEGDGVSVRTG